MHTGRFNVLCLIWLADDVSLVINVTCLHFDPELQTGRASLRWKLHEDGNSSVWESTVLIRHPTPEGIVMEVQKTTNDETRISLKPDKLYEITVCYWLLISITFTIHNGCYEFKKSLNHSSNNSINHWLIPVDFRDSEHFILRHQAEETDRWCGVECGWCWMHIKSDNAVK